MLHFTPLYKNEVINCSKGWNGLNSFPNLLPLAGLPFGLWYSSEGFISGERSWVKVEHLLNEASQFEQPMRTLHFSIPNPSTYRRSWISPPVASLPLTLQSLPRPHAYLKSKDNTKKLQRTNNKNPLGQQQIKGGRKNFWCVFSSLSNQSETKLWQKQQQQTPNTDDLLTRYCTVSFP